MKSSDIIRFVEDKKTLGMDVGKARFIYLRMLMYHLAKKLNKHICYRCNNAIENYKDISIDHLENWGFTEEREGDKELFFDVENIAFSHKKCNSAAAQAFKGRSKYVGVDLFWDKRKDYKRWRSVVKANGKTIYCGYYKDEREAAKARDLGVLKYCNGIGLMNFPENKDQYLIMIKNGWGEPLKCKICGDKHFGKGYCRKHHYRLCGGKAKRRMRYITNKS